MLCSIFHVQNVHWPIKNSRVASVCIELLLHSQDLHNNRPFPVPLTSARRIAIPHWTFPLLFLGCSLVVTISSNYVITIVLPLWTHNANSWGTNCHISYHFCHKFFHRKHYVFMSCVQLVSVCYQIVTSCWWFFRNCYVIFCDHIVTPLFSPSLFPMKYFHR